MDTAAGPMMNQIFICLTLPGIGGPSLPNTVGDLIHVQILAVPVVKVANHADRPGIGGPDTEHEAIDTVSGFRMATQQVISLGAVAGVVVIQSSGKFFSHSVSFLSLVGLKGHISSCITYHIFANMESGKLYKILILFP
jgi:hypothetical protein